MATDKQINYINVLVQQREVPADFDVNSVAEMDVTEASRTIGFLKTLPFAEGSPVAKEREVIGSVAEGVYTLTAKQAETVMNYKGEPYFGAEKVTVKVKRTKTGAFWMERVNPNHPIKDSSVRRSVMLLLAKKTPKKA
jgi:hypothetical protein